MSDWADRCHEQGGTVVIPHFPQPDGQPAVLIATYANLRDEPPRVRARLEATRP